MSEIEEFKKFSDHSPGLDFLYERVLEKAKILPEDVPFVEIGTRLGGTALIFLTAIKNSGIRRLLYTVDPYGYRPFKVGSIIMHKVAGEEYYREAMKFLSIYCSQNSLFWIPFRMTSFDFMKIYDQIDIWYDEKVLEKKPFGFVYLDGEHNEDTISKELEWFNPRMHKKGLIVIDDNEHINISDNETIKKFVERSYQNLNRSYFDFNLMPGTDAKGLEVRLGFGKVR